MKEERKRSVQISRGAWAPVVLILLITVVLGVIVVLAAEPGNAYMPIVMKPLPTPTATPLPAPASISLVPFVEGFSPGTVTDIANAGDARLFIVEKDGIIKIIMPNGDIKQFLDMSDLVETGNWEEGLLGMAFHPDYANNGFFWVAYTAPPDFHVKLSRFTVSATDPNVADPESRVDLMSIGKADEVHNGGDLAFGPDGYLYFPIGDGGPDPIPGNDNPGDPNNHGQRTDELLGGILRLDVDMTGLPSDCENGAYTVPADNPFVGNPAGCNEIWATGLRNPWRISFDRDTGDLWIADVGEWEFEEVDFQPAGSPGGVNYGWHCYEGSWDYSEGFPDVAADCSDTVPYEFPVGEYPHAEGCSITGGFVYRGQQYPTLQGHYLFADFCSHRIWRLSPTQSGWERILMYEGTQFFSTFGEDANGELYVAAHFDDTIYRVVVP